MKKLFAMLLVLALLACLFTGCKGEATQETDAPTDASTEAPNNETENNQPVETEANEPVWKVAMITDYGDITDQSFNQTTYEAGKAWCDDHGVDFTYYKPTGDSTEARVASIDQAVAKTFSFAVGDIIRDLDLRRPQFRKTAVYGHFGREDQGFAWERTDKAQALRQAIR